MQRILVTGGAGFIGSHLVPRLLEAGHHVLTIDNLSFGKMTYLPLTSDTFEFVKSDITDKVILAKILKKFEPQIVIHLAAIHYIPYCNAHPVKTTEINIMGTRILFEFCRKIELDLLFFASTAAVYPIRDVANSENSQLGPIDIYGYTKVIGEDLAKLFYLETNIKTIIGRLFNVYGPNETNPHLIPEIIDQLKSGKREVHLGNLEPKRDYIHVEDVVTSIITLINR